MTGRRPHVALWLLVSLAVAASAYAQPSSGDDRQALTDAWWTGPLMANSAGALPKGHFLVEPYLFDVRSSKVDSYGSLTYMEYGITNRLMAGVIPTFSYNRVADGPNSSGVGAGDLGILAQYSLTAFHEDSGVPAMALMVQETLPTGRYDRLDHPLADGMGAGVYTTTVQLNTQTYLWMPNGRILRMRFNVGGSFSRQTHVDDLSVYGTPAGFHGVAKPGPSYLVNAAWEYSMTQRWVLAFDLAYRYAQGSRVSGAVFSAGAPTSLAYRSRSSASFAFAPAIEYNWGSNTGVIAGVRVFTGGHNSPTTVTPAIALNYVH
ncbi:MAG: transporter [Dyella sp.]|nr:transporter [Dyella sp.]